MTCAWLEWLMSPPNHSPPWPLALPRISTSSKVENISLYAVLRVSRVVGGGWSRAQSQLSQLAAFPCSCDRSQPCLLPKQISEANVLCPQELCPPLYFPGSRQTSTRSQTWRVSGSQAVVEKHCRDMGGTGLEACSFTCRPDASQGAPTTSKWMNQAGQGITRHKDRAHTLHGQGKLCSETGPA